VVLVLYMHGRSSMNRSGGYTTVVV